MEHEAVKYIEENYPQTAKCFKAIQHEQYVLFCKKQKDYGSGNIAMGTSLKNKEDIRFSLTALSIRMNDKIQWLLNLFKKQLTPENESIEDAFQDLSVYGIIARIVSEGSWGK